MLNKSSVIFNQEEHTYTLNGVPLSGITSVLERNLFQRKYDGIPKHILDNAAERGSFIHEQIELVDSIGIIPPCEEATNYISLMKEQKLVVEDSEYLVSDNTHFATQIDKVYKKNETTYHLGDIKTTYKLDTEYLSWQLSICSYLFEIQNEGCKVDRIFGIWLRGDKKEIVDVKRISNEIIINLLACDVNGVQFKKPEYEYNLPAEYRSIENAIAEIERQEKYWKEKKKELLDGVMKNMVSSGAYKYDGESIQFVRKKDSIRKDFDKKSFENDYPELYEKYIKETPIAGSVTLKIK